MIFQIYEILYVLFRYSSKMINEDVITGTICAVVSLVVAFVLLVVTGEDTTVDENTLKCSTSSYVSSQVFIVWGCIQFGIFVAVIILGFRKRKKENKEMSGKQNQSDDDTSWFGRKWIFLVER